ncbi:hypothetical protein MMC30_009246 [Trapelia coarctata]|nr:hypothetical protein [Trapelia coarctata]
MSVPEYQQAELPAPVPMSKKFMKPVIPAVPRVFEKRRVTGNPGTPNSGSAVGEQDVENGGALQRSAKDTPVISSNQHTPKSAREQDAVGSITGLYVPESAAIVENQDETSSTSTFNQGSGTQGHTFQLPQAFYPMPGHSNPAVYPISSFRTEGFLDQPQPRLFSPYALDPNIVFGGEPDSNQSSPRSIPSAGSTTYTQPTPLSDATSYRSQSIYQGYGHLPNTFERCAPSNLVLFSAEDHYSQPAHTSPPGSDYGLPVPQIPSNAQLPSSEVFPQLPLKDETAPPDPFKTYLLDQFNNPDFADCSLHMKIEGQPTIFMLHGVVIAQNPTLKALLQSAKSFDSQGRKTLVLDATNFQLSLAVVTSFLRSCYGQTLLQDSQVINDLDLALAYLETGRLFQIPVYQDIGITGVIKSLTLDSLERPLSYVLSDTASLEVENHATRETGLYALPSRRLFEGLLVYMAVNFPDPFVLDTSAPNSTVLGGNPPTEPQQQRSKPELMSIRFGEFPSASHSIPSAESTAMSSILLSVPFSALQQILQALGQSVTQDIAGPIIEERERRRLKALEAGAETATNDPERHSWEQRVVETDSGTTTTRVSTEQN